MTYAIINRSHEITHCFHTLPELRDYDINAYERGHKLILHHILYNTMYFLETDE